jgi:endonuclease/exonuclease/phosphatase family metal-dependent hydrolase
MTKFPLLLGICCTLGLLWAGPRSGFAQNPRTALNVITYNIRYNNPADGENAWSYRKEKVASVLRFHEADLMGLQEVLRGQLNDLTAQLPEFGWVGVGREDGKDGGEFAPVFFRKGRFQLVESSTFWLSESPDSVGSVGWDAALTRICTWAELIDHAGGDTLFLFNTHFDHMGGRARRESAKLLLEKMTEIAGGYAVILTGDFNSEAASEPYRIITDRMADTFNSTQTPHHGPSATFFGFYVTAGSPGERIDFIFVNDRFTTRRHGTLSESWQGRYASDHLPVLAEIRIN